MRRFGRTWQRRVTDPGTKQPPAPAPKPGDALASAMARGLDEGATLLTRLGAMVADERDRADAAARQLDLAEAEIERLRGLVPWP